MKAAEAIALGFAGGVVSGMLGVGGGVVFVPALALVIGLSQVDAEATSLLAIVPVAALGAARQHRYGNVRARDGAILGVLAAGGVLAGVALANTLSGHTLKVAFAAVMLLAAAQLVRRRA